MKLLLLLIALSAFLIGTNSQYILIENYEYHSGCSSTAPQCNSDTLISGELYKENVCLGYTGNVYPFMLTIANNIVTKSMYGSNDTTCQGPVIFTSQNNLSQCTEVCDPDGKYGKNSQMTFVDTINIPDNTIISAWYSGVCNGEYKNSIETMFYGILNKCNAAYSSDSVSTIQTCNSTNIIAHTYPEGQLNCNGTPEYSDIEPLRNICDDYTNLNLLQICNL